MTNIKEFIFREKSQYLVFGGLVSVVIGMTGLLYFFDKLIFERFFGGINPLAAVLLVAVSGFILFTFLLSAGRFAIHKKGSLKESSRFLWLSALFALITTLIDFNAGTVGFSAKINILFPKSLLFYPVMGFIAEIVFHILPLFILLAGLTAVLKKINYEKIILICFLIIPLAEVVYQIIPMSHFPLWAVGAFSLNLFLFELSQLLIFRKYDFVSMYLFRLVYYLIWHIGWGYFRLKLLF